MPLALLVTLLLNNRVYYAHFASVVRMEEFASKMIDTFEVLRTIKIFGAERRYQQVLEEKFNSLVKARCVMRKSQAFPATWGWLLAALITGGILWYGGSRVIAGQITAGQLLVLFGMASFYLIPVQRFPEYAPRDPHFVDRSGAAGRDPSAPGRTGRALIAAVGAR